MVGRRLIGVRGKAPSRRVTYTGGSVSASLAAIRAMSAGTWLEIDGTTPNTGLPSLTPPQSGAPSTLWTAWGSAVILGRKLFVWGGGHTDSSINALAYLDLDDMESGWRWYNSADNDSQIVGNNNPDQEVEFANGNPVSRHPYDTIVGIGNRLYAMGGAGLWRDAQNDPFIRYFDITTDSWTTGIEITDSHNFIAGCDVDANGDIWFRGADSRPFFRYNVDENTYDTFGNIFSDPVSGTVVAAIHRANGIFLFLTNSATPIGAFDISGGNPSGNFTVPTTSGDDSLVGQDCGLSYADAKGAFYAWFGGASVHKITMSSVSAAVFAAETGTGDTAPTISSTGVLGRWIWWAAEGVFLLTNNPSENTFAYKPAA